MDTRPRFAQRQISLAESPIPPPPCHQPGGGRPKKTVRFSHNVNNDKDNNGEILPPTVCRYPAVPAEWIPALFWSREERKEALARQRQEASKLLELHPEVVDAIHCLHQEESSLVGGGSSMTNPPPHQEDDTRNPTETTTVMTTERARQILLTQSDHVLGLESYLTSRIGEHREWTVRKLLSIQATYRQQQQQPQINDTQPPLETQLQVWSVRLSAPATRYAHDVAKQVEREHRLKQLQQRQQQLQLQQPQRQRSFLATDNVVVGNHPPCQHPPPYPNLSRAPEPASAWKSSIPEATTEATAATMTTTTRPDHVCSSARLLLQSEASSTATLAPAQC